MQAIKVIKLQLQADNPTFFSLDGQSRICNWLYNHLLDEANALKSKFIETGDLKLAKSVYTERGLKKYDPIT